MAPRRSFWGEADRRGLMLMVRRAIDASPALRGMRGGATEEAQAAGVDKASARQTGRPARPTATAVKATSVQQAMFRKADAGRAVTLDHVMQLAGERTIACGL